jgi:hypothetical protein
LFLIPFYMHFVFHSSKAGVSNTSDSDKRMRCHI